MALHTRFSGTVRRVLSLRGAAFLAAVATLTALMQTGRAGLDQPAHALPLLPDLQVTYTNVVSNNAGTFLVFKVRNEGNGDAGRFAVVVKAANGAVLEVFPVPLGLAAGFGAGFDHKLPACIPAGILTRTIVVDSGNDVFESDEGNNEKKSVFVYPPSCFAANVA